MKISQGQILEFKDGKKRKVLGVCGEVYLMSTFSDFDKASSSNSTYKDLLDFDLIVKEENWKPELEDSCDHTWEVTLTDKKQFNYCGKCEQCNVILRYYPPQQ